MYKTITGIIIIAVTILVVALYILQTPEFNIIAEDERSVFLAERALEEYYQNGSESFSTISNNSNFHDDSVYVFVVDTKSGKIMAHSINDSLVGKDVTELMSVKGINIGTAILESVTEKGVWIEYKWENPDNNEIMYKKLWVKLFEDHIFGAVNNY